MKIAFHTNQFSIRGTEVALYDYAFYTETLLHHTSVILVPESSNSEGKNDKDIISKFMSRFQVYFYKSLEDMENFLQDCDLLYCIKYGTNDGIISKNIKTVIHCVFDMSEPHGNVYVAISEAIAKKFNRTEFVPHMISLKPSITKDNLRKELNIPKEAVVFARYGGEDTFNLPFCHEVIKQIVNERKDIYFLFINTPSFYEHPQIIHLGKVITDEEKNRFICTTDAHLECSNFGHSFGLSLAENYMNKKPPICYNGWIWNRAHLDILGNEAITFKTKEEFYDILVNFNPKDYEGKEFNAYKEFSPEKVMEQFKKVFLE